MNTSELLAALRANNVTEHACLIYPQVPQEFIYCLIREGQRYRVILNERGNYYVDRRFETEHEACRFLLRRILSDYSLRTDRRSIDRTEWPKLRREILKRNGFDPDESDEK